MEVNRRRPRQSNVDVSNQGEICFIGFIRLGVCKLTIPENVILMGWLISPMAFAW